MNQKERQELRMKWFRLKCEQRIANAGGNKNRAAELELEIQALQRLGKFRHKR